MILTPIVIAGSVAQRPYQGGHTWVFLQYLLGFRRLGWDVLLLDRLEPDMCVDSGGQPCAPEDSEGFLYLRDVMTRFGLADHFAVACDGGRRYLGLDRQQVLRRVRRSALFLNVMGFFDDDEILAAAPLRALLDIDPGFGQMWQELGLHELFRGHDRYVTIGLNVGRAGCEIPPCGIDWVTTPQPVVLDHWPTDGGCPGGAFTSIASWRGDFAPIQYKGKSYGLRAHEFRKFVELPRRSGVPFEVALDIHPDETRDLALLEGNGWALADPKAAAGDPWAYQRYIRGSRAEFMVAKNLYVQSRAGWFSDRSVAYLASGRPVLAQDTGFAEHFPPGRGLLAFSTADEALAGIEAITGDYTSHVRAAREVAINYFDSDVVLPRLLGALGVA